MAKNKNRQRGTNSPAVVVKDKIPLVSVIIPMYNAEKFVAQTLESLCYQTMKNFEVVVVDDCSTDNSVAVVESFKDKLIRGGVQCHIIKLAKNTGMPYLPRNVAINFSRGKYLAFLDNDDFFTKTALEELTTLAEEYQADIVNMPEVFRVDDNGADFDELINPANHKIENCQGINVPRLEKVAEFPNDIAKRVHLWLTNKFHWATWATFCRRDFWISNQITFPRMPVSDDTLANFACLCFAKKILSVPNITYIHRLRHDSISRDNGNPEKFFHKWLSNLTLGFKAFDEIMSRIPFFSEHPDYRYAVLNWFFLRGIEDAGIFPVAYLQIHTAILNQFVEKEFSGDDAGFSAYLFNTVNVQRLQIIKLQQELQKFQQK